MTKQLFLLLLLLSSVFAQGPYLLTEGDHVTLDVNETHYVLIDVTAVTEDGALIKLNGQSAKVITEDNWVDYPDGSQIFLQELLVSDGELDKVEIYVDAKSAFAKPGTVEVLQEQEEQNASVNESDVKQEAAVEDIELPPLMAQERAQASWWQRVIDWLFPFW